MTITRKQVAGKLAAYLHHRISLAELVDWAEQAMMEGDFGTRNVERIRNVVARLGLADVRAFGLTWEDCEQFSIGWAIPPASRLSRRSRHILPRLSARSRARNTEVRGDVY